MTVTVVSARWSTDRGIVETRDWGPQDRPVSEALERMANHMEDQGVFVLKLLKVVTQDAPLLGGSPSMVLATKPALLPVTMFHMKRKEMAYG